MRVETGVLQFGDDWPGVFIRGDNAFALLEALRGSLGSAAMGAARRELCELLRSCDVREKPQPQMCRPFAECALDSDHGSG